MKKIEFLFHYTKNKYKQQKRNEIEVFDIDKYLLDFDNYKKDTPLHETHHQTLVYKFSNEYYQKNSAFPKHLAE